MILAFDTSTDLTSVALVDGPAVIVERGHLDPRAHAEVLAPMLAEALATARAERGIAPSDVEALACGVGPGPYTGLRVGIATARAVGAAWRLPVYGLCSLDAIAAAAAARGRSTPFGVAADARRSEVYWAWYGSDGMRLKGPFVMRPGDIDPSLRAGEWLGAGALLHASVLDVAPGVDADDALAHPQAAWVARRVQALLDEGARPDERVAPLSPHGDDGSPTSVALEGMALLPAQPLYLRRPDAQVPGVPMAGVPMAGVPTPGAGSVGHA